MLPILHLHTLDPAMAAAWAEAFAGATGVISVAVVEQDILAGPADALVSPANSFGYMDGGIDLAYRRFFGAQLEARLQRRIADARHGELPVGDALLIETGHDAIRHLVAAPTMRVPEPVADTVNVYLALRAALLAVLEHNAHAPVPIRSLRSPALGTGAGHMPLARAAFQMRAACESVAGPAPWRRSRDALFDHHRRMRSA
jgi:O-acetyl-ADP-ribose deacetylase (regulator of RNase III)